MLSHCHWLHHLSLHALISQWAGDRGNVARGARSEPGNASLARKKPTEAHTAKPRCHKCTFSLTMKTELLELTISMQKNIKDCCVVFTETQLNPTKPTEAIKLAGCLVHQVDRTTELYDWCINSVITDTYYVRRIFEHSQFKECPTRIWSTFPLPH